MAGAADGRATESRSAAGDRNPWLLVTVVSLATFMEVLDMTIVNVALQHIAGSLAASYEESTWILTSYLISNAVVMPMSGWLSTVIGRKRFYMMCVGLFTASSALCGMAPSLGMLIFFRILQGLGGGGLSPTEQSFLADSFPPEKRSLAFAAYGITVILAPTLGPTIGGLITDATSWRWIFFMNLPVGLLSLGLVHFLLVEPAPLRRERAEMLKGGLHVDWPGIAALAVWMGCLQVVLDKGQLKDWFASDLIIGLSVASFLGFAFLIPWALMRRDAVVDLRTFADRHFAASWLAMLGVGVVLLASTQMLPQLLQQDFGYDATHSGLVLMPGGLVMLAIMPVAGALGGRVQPRWFVMFGAVALTAALWHLTTLSPDASFGYVAWARVYQMVGMPFLFVSITSTAYAHLPPEKTAQASAQINVARILGGSIGIALTTTLLANRQQWHHARLAEGVTSTSLAYQSAVERLGDVFQGRGGGMGSSAGQALAWIGQAIEHQASLLSFVDAFAALALAAAAMIPLALLLRRVQPGAGGGAL